jgi:hypothetical protein
MQSSFLAHALVGFHFLAPRFLPLFQVNYFCRLGETPNLNYGSPSLFDLICATRLPRADRELLSGVTAAAYEAVHSLQNSFR